MRATARAEFLRFHRKSSISPTSWIADPEAMDDSRPGHRALRKGRASAAGQVYLVTTAAYRRNPFFREWDVACEACRAITAAATAADVFLLCWVLMPDHWHGLLRVGGRTSLSSTMNRIKGCSAIAANRVRASTGAIWARGFHDHALRREEDAIATARYVIANPVRAGLVANVRDYAFWDACWLAGADRSPASGLLRTDPG